MFKIDLKWIIIGVFGFLVVLFFLFNIWRNNQNVKMENKLSRNQTEAILQSGQDAVSTLSNQQASEIQSDQTTRTNEDAIRKASGSDQPVTPDAHLAGMRALCQRPSYRGSPKCVQYAPAP